MDPYVNSPTDTSVCSVLASIGEEEPIIEHTECTQQENADDSKNHAAVLPENEENSPIDNLENRRVSDDVNHSTFTEQRNDHDLECEGDEGLDVEEADDMVHERRGDNEDEMMDQSPEVDREFSADSVATRPRPGAMNLPLTGTSGLSSVCGSQPLSTSSTPPEPPHSTASPVDPEEGSSIGSALSSRQGRVSRRARVTLSAASRLLRKKIPQTGHLMLPRRLWMQTVHNQGCKVVVTFSAKADDGAVNWLSQRIKSRIPELVTEVKTNSKSCRSLYVSTSIEGLVKGATDLRLHKRTKPEFGSSLKEITSEDLPIFLGVEDLSTFFTTQETHSIIIYLLDTLRATEEDLEAAAPLRLGEAIVSKWKTVGLIDQLFPLHEHELLSQLQKSWVQTFVRYQPLDQIRDYFGDKIAIYFAWLGFYTASLVFPAFIGLTLWLFCWGTDQATEDKAFVAIALLNVLWGTVWLEAWKRRSAELVHKWGLVRDTHELLQEPRPQFKGQLKQSLVTGRLEPWYPTWRRNIFKYCVTLPLVFVGLVVLFLVMFFILKLQDICDEWVEASSFGYLISWGPKLLMAISISVMDELYTRVAVWVNDKENYRADETYHNYLIVKLALFRFVNSFLALFYIAFYLQDMDRLKEQLAALLLMRQIVGNIKESCVPYLMEQWRLAKLSFDLFGALSPTQETSKEWPNEEDKSNPSDTTEKDKTDEGIRDADPEKKVTSTSLDNSSNNEDSEVREIGSSDDKKVPESDDVTTKDMSFSRTSSKSRIVSQADVESNMQHYDGTFEDYLEMLIQFGYVMLFSSAFPLAGIYAFFNNLIEIRSDAFKLCCVHQRPFPQRVSSIGVWQDAMEFLGLLGIIVNCMLIGQSGLVHRMFPEMTNLQTLLLIVVMEHVMIALKYVISYAIPDVPEWIMLEEAKTEFKRREILRRISSSNSPPTREVSQPSSPRFPAAQNQNTETSEINNLKEDSCNEKEELPTKKSEDKFVKEFREYSPNRAKIEDNSPLKKKNANSKLSKKFSIPEFSSIKRVPPTDPTLTRKISTQDFVSLRKIPRTPDSPKLNNLSSEFASVVFPSENNSTKQSVTPIDSSFTVKTAKTPLEFAPKFPLLKTGSRVSTQSLLSDQNDHKNNLNFSIPQSASVFMDQNRQFTFPVTTEETVMEENTSEEKPSGPSRYLEDRFEANKQQSINQKALLHSMHQLPEKPPQESFQKSFSLQKSNTDSDSPPVDSSLEISSGSGSEDKLSENQAIGGALAKRRHPNKFLKRAQSFSQFLKKKPTLPERRKRTGESSRDDYYLPTSHETIEEPQGEMMVVPVEKLVSVADLDFDRKDWK